MAERVRLLRPRTCPICGKPAEPTRAPFCSKACKDEDLRRWLAGGYAIPGEARPIAPEDEGEAQP
ncbi:MAG: DNA gyrase inhibitor YacG [Alphaproteobacteria bacterium]|nr:DNA gyrase inhibitor YacG [Alphaproteobacteria bacterium]